MAQWDRYRTGKPSTFKVRARKTGKRWTPQFSHYPSNTVLQGDGFTVIVDPKGKPGAPKGPRPDTLERRREIVARWKKADAIGTRRADFCTAEGIDPSTLSRYIKFVAENP